MPSPTPRYQAAHSNGGGSGGGSHGGGGAAAVARVRTALLLLLAAAAVTSLLISGRHTRMHAAVFARRLPERPGHNASSQPARSAAAAPTGGVRVGNGSIPRIIHQNFLGGQQQLLVEALKPLSHFRKEWWQSCKTHHPGWQHMFWDAAACEDLLQRHYAWFLSTWRALDSTVLKSDAIRPFILHHHGGVYLDLDSECFADMGPWLEGAHVVLQAEERAKLNNAQMASAPDHALWPLFQREMHRRLRRGQRWALDATGPYCLTHVLRRLIRKPKGDLAGRYTLADGSRIAVYGATQWFTPCPWNDWGCAVQLARDQPLMLGRAAAATAEAAQRAQAAAAGAGQQQGANSSVIVAAHGAALAAPPDAFPVMLSAAAVAGVHHFSGSWLGLDGSKSLSLRGEGVAGVLRFLYNGTGFVQHHCQQLTLLPQAGPLGTAAGLQQQAASCTCQAAVPVCWERIAAAAASRTCSVLSLKAAAACGDGTQPQQLWAELALAAAGCRVQLVTPAALDVPAAAAAFASAAAAGVATAAGRAATTSSNAAALASNVRVVQAVLATSTDPFAQPPEYTLQGLVDAMQLGANRLTLLLLAPDAQPPAPRAPHANRLLEVLNALYLSSARVLARADAVVLTLQPPRPGHAHQSFAAYQHLWQEHGFVGYFHAAAAAGQVCARTPAAEAAAAGGGGGDARSRTAGLRCAVVGVLRPQLP